MLHNLNFATQFTHLPGPPTPIAVNSSQITAGQGSITTALPMPTNQWLTMPNEIWSFIFSKVAIASDLINLSSTCQHLHNVYLNDSTSKLKKYQHYALLHNLATPELHQQLYNKVINRDWGKITLPDKDTEEWQKLIEQPLDPKLRGEAYGVALIKKLCIVGWDLLLQPKVLENHSLASGLMRLLVDLARHIRYPEVYVDKLFPKGFDEKLFHQLANIHVDRCIQLVAKYFPFQEHSAAHAFLSEQFRLMGIEEQFNFFIGIKRGVLPSALYASAQLGEQKGVDRLLRRLAPECDLEQRNVRGVTVLLFASYMQEPEIILPLIKHGADYNTADYEGYTPLMGLCTDGGNLALVHYFSKLPNINVNAKDSKGRTALHRAAQESKFSVLRELLNFPMIDVDARTNEGLSAIDYAINHQRLANLQVLLRDPKCAIDNTIHYSTASRLCFAIEYDLLPWLETLLSHSDKDPAIRLSAFNYAIWKKKQAIAAMFLQDMDNDFIKQALALTGERGKEKEYDSEELAPEYVKWLEMVEELLINNYSED
jgi:hypothetical protein